MSDGPAQPVPADAAALRRRPMVRAATTFGLGYCRPASGTWGSLPPVVLAGVLTATGHAGTPAWYGAFGLIAIVFTVVCIAAGRDAERAFGRKDPSQVVADETAGMAVTLLFLPPSVLAGPTTTPLAAAAWLAGAFVLWRVADIIKPWPANALQRLPAGWGIVIDDLVSAVYAGLLLLLVGLPVI